jgi:hypothetical protein
MFSGGLEAVGVSGHRLHDKYRHTLHLHSGKVFSSEVDEDDFGQDGVERTFLELNRQMAEHLALQFIMRSKLFAFVDLAVQPNEPSNQCAACVVAVRRFMIVDQLALVPCGDNALEFGFEVCLCLRVW